MAWTAAHRPSFGPMMLCLITILASCARGLQISYCSSQNTGSGWGPIYNQYQSNGACQTSCQNQFAYAVLQGYNCWCSDYAPSDQTDTGSCNKGCPGFQEQCGNSDEGLFGYYQLGKVQPSGTVGGGSSPTASSSPSPPPPPSIATPTIPIQLSTTLSPVPSTSPSAADSDTISWSPTASALVTTVLGSIQTVIITPTIPPAPAETQITTIPGPAPDSFWSNAGKVAGTFVALGLVIVALIALAIYLFIRRKRAEESLAIRSVSDGDNGSAMAMPFGTEKRSSKLTLATAGLGGGRRGNSGERSGGTHDNTPASMSRRTSMPMVHDQRLDPRALYNLDNAVGSHASLGSFRDDRDYSRPVLHVRNPDQE